MERVVAGKYEIIRELGEGGSGRVYLVRHVDLGVSFALKVLNRSLSEDTRFIERFKREAEVLLRFSHAGSVQLRDFGKTGEGLYYMAMDYCEGNPLKDVLEKEGVLSPERAVNIAVQILDVLEAAHSLGIIHRDIKPDNIMLSVESDGLEKIKILDFGIAKLKENMDLDSTMTMEGASIGTPHYMAPEQAAGEGALDHRVDIYSTGILAYELIAGEPPFAGKTVVQTLLKHLTQPPPPFDESLGVSPVLEKEILKALEKNRDSRFQSAAEFRDALRNALQKPQVEAPVAIVEKKPEESPANSGSDTTVLCLDDDEMILNILKHLLEKEGYRVFTASNCSAIHPYLFDNKVDLLITDVQMPDISGVKVCTILKKSLPDLKIVLFSNVPDRDLEKYSKECRSDGWISKNAPPNEWLNKIKTYL